MLIITGGAGFIGSNLVKGLSQRGYDKLVVVDDLTQGIKYKNIVDCDIEDYIDKDEFLEKLEKGFFSNQIKAIFHQGACSATTEWDGRYMMKNNYDYSKKLLQACLPHQIPFIYASSAAVYGLNTVFKENPDNESPLNVYGYSKLQFDRYVRRLFPHNESQIAGLRYFNVFGQGEAHKGSMASVMFHFHHQIQKEGRLKLFQGTDAYRDGEQRRDFIFVGDVVDVNIWMFENPTSGIFNVGTGNSRSFNDVAKGVIAHHQKGQIEYIPFPEHLKGHYQNYTQADITALRKVGYQKDFTSLEEGIKHYLAHFDKA